MRNDKIFDLSQPLYVNMRLLKNLGPIQSGQVLNLDMNPVQITELTFTTHIIRNRGGREI
jgi:kynurenine formamidase